MKKIVNFIKKVVNYIFQYCVGAGSIIVCIFPTTLVKDYPEWKQWVIAIICVSFSAVVLAFINHNRKFIKIFNCE